MTHSTSSDSESSSRSGRVNLKTRKKKKKKPLLSPQTSINNIWRCFSSPRPQQALAILPLDQPEKAAPNGNHSNELLTEGRLRAVTQCQRKVNEIVKECKRVNMRYRDHDWDLLFDFADQGHCLNGLRQTIFDLGEVSCLDTESNAPGAVKRVHEIFSLPTFMKNVDGGDVKQGKLSNCWFVAGLTALANLEHGLTQTCAAHDTGVGVYGFVFYRDGAWTYTIIDDTLYLQSPCWDSPSLQRALLQQTDRVDAESEYKRTYQTGSKALFFAQCRDQNETWVPLIEKAYAKAHGDYAALACGWVGEGLEDLSGGVTTQLFTSDILDPDVFWADELSKVNQEFLFGASTGILDGGYGERDGISEGHAYIVVAAHTLKSGKRLLKIRNPWAHARKGIWEGAWSDGSKEWTAEVQQELGHRFGGDSVFWISFEDFLRKYSHLDRTKLFRDVDWRCTQSWISINVPWRACYQDRFRIILTKESPAVVTVSQLDGRYFNGLHGQYSFCISFRIYHEADSGVRRCVAQSHGNYLMTRSASVELPELTPGTYTICTRVDAERDTSLESVEDVIKQECRARTENLKLAQVGFAYDLAHKKAEAYTSEVKRLEKIKDRERASKCRQEERRRRWEERHIKRVLTKKQKQKNKGKQRTRCKVHKETDSASNKEPLISTHTGAGALMRNANADVEGTGDYTLLGGVEKGTVQQEIIVGSHTGDGMVIRSCHGRLVGAEESPVKPVPVSTSSRLGERLPGSSFWDSAGDSSDSPIGEWEELYNTDDTTHSLEKESRDEPRRNTRCEHAVRGALVGESTDSDNSSEDETPSPWNAVCIVGVRVYSKDKAITLQTLFD
ncbi:uncharacterized protein FPOAC1_014003 [Fusarium poae]|uniref:uncharacterized protein n=1 Tax=Fusarium poae TaxID=36050 RepID=UPI001D05B7FA|nr:uncharacterized protein FPOAC1_014003 [Fusarium poae]KAG8664296.1 hypothetical protein FPOAC1_014003 [Fusarium poae]